MEKLTSSFSEKKNEETNIENTPFHKLIIQDKDCKKRDVSLLKLVQILYLVFLVIWILLIYFLKLNPPDFLGWLILLIPIVVFAIAFANMRYHTIDSEKEMLQGNWIAFSYLIALVLINWCSGIDKKRFNSILLVSLIFLTFSVIDIWGNPKYCILNKHFKSICQTLALILLIYAVYLYYKGK